MAFFTKKHKTMAKKCSFQELMAGYDNSEISLERASFNGSTKQLNKAMKEHRDYEYALLYRNTPKFKKQNKRR